MNYNQQAYEDIKELLFDKLTTYHNVINEAREVCKRNGDKYVSLHENFWSCVNQFPLFLISEVICHEQTTERFQVQLLQAFFTTYSVPYTVTEFIKFASDHNSANYKLFFSSLGITDDYCADFWKDIFDMLFCSQDADLLVKIMSPIIFVPLIYQAPLGIASTSGDYRTTYGATVFNNFEDSLGKQFLKYQQEMIALHANDE